VKISRFRRLCSVDHNCKRTIQREMNPTEADAEASGREELDRYSSGGGTKPGNDNSMDWEEITDAEARDSAIAPQIVSEVPGGTGGHIEDFDMETFSFESDEEEEEDTNAKPSSGLSTSFDIQILKSAIEASAEALEMVTGKDVVMVTGKTGEIISLHSIYFRVSYSVLIFIFLVLLMQQGLVNQL